MKLVNLEHLKAKAITPHGLHEPYVALSDIDAAPTQEVAHCADCRHYFANRYGIHSYCVLAGYTVPPHGFCYYGDRRKT